jgi:membrane-associated phospholipid phosphatase
MKFASKYFLVFVLGAFAIQPVATAYGQAHDSVRRVYNVNPWVSGGICIAGAASGILTIPARSKPNLTPAELQSLNRDAVPSYDRWSLQQDPSVIPTYETYSVILQITMGALPAALLFDKRIRSDGWNVMLMGLEVNAVVIGIYTVSPLGPLFQTRYRPVVYYTDAPVARDNGNNKNSFYSGHVASAAAASFFMAKVYSDYHPEMGADKYWLFGAAVVPPLLMAYARLKALDHFPSDIAVGFAVGTLCGILIPEIHRIGDQDMSMGAYSSPEGTGLTLRWTTDMSLK